MKNFVIEINGNTMLPAIVTADQRNILGVKLLWDSSEKYHDDFIEQAKKYFADNYESINPLYDVTTTYGNFTAYHLWGNTFQLTGGTTHIVPNDKIISVNLHKK